MIDSARLSRLSLQSAQSGSPKKYVLWAVLFVVGALTIFVLLFQHGSQS